MNVLILGGNGFIGRNLAEFLVQNNYASKLRVADKVLPQTAYLTPSQLSYFQSGESSDSNAPSSEARIEFKQCNLSNKAHIERAFGPVDSNAEGYIHWDLVVNLAAETKFGQPADAYKQFVFELSMKCIEASKERKVGRYIEMSTAQVYDASKKPSKETDTNLKPWTQLAQFKLNVENELKKLSSEELNWVLLRPSLVYGISDVAGLMPRVTCGAIYKHTDQKMKFLWSGDLKTNTVNVADVVKAIYHVGRKEAWSEIPSGSVFNLSDKGDTDQKRICKILEEIFGIKTGFHGSITSSLAKIKLAELADEANDGHLGPWSELTNAKGIDASKGPLTPYIDKELLYNNPLSVDGSAIEKTGFEYSVKELTTAEVQKCIDHYVALGFFPDMTKESK